jgi:carboxypeptidase Q
MTDFRKLMVRQKAHALSLRADQLSKRMSRRKPALARQLERAADSVPANIAEGRGRSTDADFAHFLSIAVGSVTEGDSHLQRGFDAGEVAGEEHHELSGAAVEVRRMLIGLRKRVRGEEKEREPHSTRPQSGRHGRLRAPVSFSYRECTIAVASFMRLPIALTISALLVTRVEAQSDLTRIRNEGLTNSHALEYFDHLTNVIGPRLTGSPAFKVSVDWSADKLKSFGLTSVHEESWPYGRGWTLEKFTLEMVEPRYFPLIAFPEAWSPSTPGEITARPVYIGDLANADAVRARTNDLRGAIVLATKPQDVFITKDRLQPTEHVESVAIGAPRANVAAGPLPRAGFQSALRDLGVGMVLRPSEGSEGTMFVLGNRASTAANSVPSVIVAAEQYNMLVRAMQAGSPVKLRANVQSRYYAADTNGYNVIAEIPGADPRIGDEVVLLGAHIDSWHSATGASDNADAVAELIEAMRILKASGVAPRRTIRAAIWGGEEEGLLGSKAYVQQHYGGDANAANREKLSIYLNNDPGTGPIYGWYAEGSAAAKAVLDEWLAPLTDLGGRRNIMEKIGNTDHLSFTALGLPAFNTIQDYTEYDTRMHHTNMDFYERVNPEDLKRASVMLATFAYQAAMRAERFPRPGAVP